MEDRMQLMGLVSCAFIIPIFALFAPLGMATIFALLALHPIMLFIKQGKLGNIWNDSDVNKIIVIFFAYSLISSFWAINPHETIGLWVQVLGFFIGSMGLFAYLPQINDKAIILKALLVGVVLALVFANIEIFTDGFISQAFGVSYKVSNKFDIVIFNRGASVLSLMSWAVIYYLVSLRKTKAALAIFIAVLLTLFRLDSLSTVLGFLVSGAFIFPFVYYKGQKALKALSILAVVGVFSFAAVAAMIDAHKMVGNVPVIPGAASDNRLYIWDYSAKQALKKPVFGWGLNSSRSYPVLESDYVQGGRSPLPLHPHNNTLQVWLELGVVGLVIFSAFLWLILTRIAKTIYEPYMLASCTALFANYFLIGQTGYGIWQGWLIGSGILAAAFLKIAMDYKSQALPD